MPAQPFRGSPDTFAVAPATRRIDVISHHLAHLRTKKCPSRRCRRISSSCYVPALVAETDDAVESAGSARSLAPRAEGLRRLGGSAEICIPRIGQRRASPYSIPPLDPRIARLSHIEARKVRGSGTRRERRTAGGSGGLQRRALGTRDPLSVERLTRDDSSIDRFDFPMGAR